MRVGMTMRVVNAPNYNEPRDALSHDCVHWLQDLGHQPVLIPNGLSSPREFLDATGIGGVVLTSGNDAVPRPGKPDDTSVERDRTEHAVLDFATQAGIPVFGICRGLHVINRYFHGGLTPSLEGGPSHVALNHRVNIAGRFIELAGADEVDVNSYHNQGIRLAELSPDLTLFARSADGIVEGAVHKTLPILGIQWHPERANPAAGFDKTLAQRLFSEKAFWK